MGELHPGSDRPGAALDSISATNGGIQYLPYRPPGSEYTPPASPQPSKAHSPPTAKKSFGSLRSKHPATLQMNATAAPAYERPLYSPSPSSSPPLPPTLPSPHFPPRQRAPSLLRHAAASSPLNEGYPRAGQPIVSPTFAPMSRQVSGPGPTSDPRAIFNPLASNPVDRDSSTWEPSGESAAESAQSRPRGMTSSSQQEFVPHPPLRAATSIPDYGHYRGTERPNPSGAYRPNRGGANWSHNDQFPLRHFRPEEARASFRSAWTNASSSFVDASGTERSSMATGRSSISDNRASVYSGDQSTDRDLSSDATQPSEEPNDDDDIQSVVEDMIDSYYGNDESMLRTSPYQETLRSSSSHIGTPEVEMEETPQSSTEHDQNYQAPRSRDPHRPSLEADERPLSYLGNGKLYDSPTKQDDQKLSQSSDRRHNSQGEYLPPLQLSPLHLQYSPSARSGAEEHIQGPVPQQQGPASPDPERQRFWEIYNDMKVLPPLPKNKSRLSRQDWANIQTYSKRNSNVPESNAPNKRPPLVKRPPLATQLPPAKESDPLPEVDEDEAYPRRASTSVFDRRSTLFALSGELSSTPNGLAKSKTLEFAEEARPTGKRQSGLTVANSSPVSTSFPDGKLLSVSLTPSTSTVERDQYGFKKATDKITPQQYDAWYAKYEQHVSRRRSKWVSLMEKFRLSTKDPVQFPDCSERVRRYVRKGYPPEWRGEMWWFYSGGQKKLGEMPGLYASLVARVGQGELDKDDREAIETDLDRTFPNNIYFRPDPRPENPDAQGEPSIFKDLREVLQCFALNNPGIGYCQSLNFIAGLLLLFMKQDKERVFILLTIITQQHLPGAHARSLANTEVNVLMMLIKEYLPKVWASINDTDLINNGLGSHAHPDSKFQRQPTVALSCTSWFMSLFVGVLPIEVVLRVWDAFLYEGPRALFRYALAIFKLGEPEIKKYHPGDGELFMTVQNLPRTCLDPNVLHDIAFVKKGFGSLSQNVIDQKRMFWQEQVVGDKKGKEAVKKNGLLAVNLESTETPGDEEKKKGGGLRRKASRRLFKKK